MRDELLDRARMAAAAEINAVRGTREQLEQTYGQVWDTRELAGDFEITGFMAPFVIVRRKLDGKRGSLAFQHDPRFYFDFREG